MLVFVNKGDLYLDIDLEIGVDDIDISLVEEINKLEPFGMSNPSPIFSIRNLTLKQKKLMGSTKEHLKLIIDTPKGAKDCVWWSRGDVPLIAGDKLDIAFAPQLNTFNGTTDIQLIIKDIHSRGKLPIMVGGTGLYADNTVFATTFSAPKRDEKLSVDGT